jgi:hypothetical protein
MQPRSWNAENRLLLCFFGAALLPFAAISLYLWTSRALQAGTEFADWVAISMGSLLGVACIAGMPLRPIIRVALACLYVPCLWYPLLYYAIYFVIKICGETI